MSFTTYQEVTAEGRAGRRNVVAGEGTLVVQKNFTWQGERYRAGITRVSPDHPVCDSEYAALLKPAYERESSPAVLRFLERRLADPSRPARRRPGGESWRLSPRQSWRLG
jgi:hypothetical protein